MISLHLLVALVFTQMFMLVAVPQPFEVQSMISLLSSPNSSVATTMQYFSVSNSSRVHNRYMIKLRDSVSDATVQLIENVITALHLGVIIKYTTVMRGFCVDTGGLALPLETLRQLQWIESIQEDHMLYTQQTQQLSDNLWGLDRLDQSSGLDGQYQFQQTGQGVHAYIIDSGIDAAHAEFGGRADTVFVATSLQAAGGRDCTGHGSHVAGVIGGTNVGVAKLISLHSLRVVSCSDSSQNSEIIAALDWIVKNAQKPAVINMSLGPSLNDAHTYDSNRLMDVAIANVEAAGILMFVAAGNDNADACSGSPGASQGAYRVAAVDRNDRRAPFSDFGACVDFFAPGVDITSVLAYGSFKELSGTSQASPFAAGVAALYLQSNPQSAPRNTVAAMKSVAAQNVVQNPSGSPNLLLQAVYTQASTTSNSALSPGANNGNLVPLAPANTINPVNGPQNNGLFSGTTGIILYSLMGLGGTLCVILLLFFACRCMRNNRNDKSAIVGVQHQNQSRMPLPPQMHQSQMQQQQGREYYGEPQFVPYNYNHDQQHYNPYPAQAPMSPYTQAMLSQGFVLPEPQQLMTRQESQGSGGNKRQLVHSFQGLERKKSRTVQEEQMSPHANYYDEHDDEPIMMMRSA